MKKWSSKPFEKERAKLFKKQEGKCAICRKPQITFKRRLNLDHNHKTGQLRGLLCYRCNKFVVGRHDYLSARALLQYLKVEKDNWNWPYLRNGWGGKEWACIHGVGHSHGVHGCEGCCNDPNFPKG